MRRQFASFYMGENLFGIDVLLVREINQDVDITKVDPSPDFIIGLMNLRGQIVAITDLGVKLGINKEADTERKNCIVLKTDSELEHLNDEGMDVGKTSQDMIGLMVDKIGDMVTVEEEEIENPPSNVNGVDGKYLSGVIKLENQLLVTLKLEEILAMESELGE